MFLANVPHSASHPELKANTAQRSMKKAEKSVGHKNSAYLPDPRAWSFSMDLAYTCSLTSTVYIQIHIANEPAWFLNGSHVGNSAFSVNNATIHLVNQAGCHRATSISLLHHPYLVYHVLTISSQKKCLDKIFMITINTLCPHFPWTSTIFSWFWLDSFTWLDFNFLL